MKKPLADPPTGPAIDPLLSPSADLTAPKVHKGVYLIRSNPKWPEIQRHIVVGDLQPAQLCERYNIRREDGALAIFAVVKYGEWLRERHKACFDRLGDIEARAIRNECLEIHRERIEKARVAYDLAMSLKSTRVVKGVGKGRRSHVEDVPTPDFIAAKEFLDVMASGANGLGDMVGLNQENPVQVNQDNRSQVINLLALPKASPPSQAVKMIDVAKSA